MTFITEDITTATLLRPSRVKSDNCSGTTTTRHLAANGHGRPTPVEEAPPKRSPKDCRFGKRILIVDRDPARRGSLTDILVGEGYFVIPAANGQQALDFASKLPVHLVLLDLDKPVKKGRKTFEQFTLNHPFTPIVVTTANPTWLVAELSPGADALLEKPMYIPTLLETIEKLVA